MSFPTTPGRAPVRSKMMARLFRLLPPIKPTNEDLSAVTPIKPGWEHYKVACLSICGAVAVHAVTSRLVPFSRHSVITATGKLVEVVTGGANAADTVIAVSSGVVICVVIRKLTKKRGALKQAAMQEEQWFRLGSEDWTWKQQFVSNLVFGAVHLFNLYVPLSAIPVMTAGGWCFTWVYCKSYRLYGSRLAALQQAAATHAAYNTLALGAVPVSAVGYSVYRRFK